MALRFNPLTALEGSFRGFPFLISRESKQLGLRGVQHEYPDRDIPYFEPLGRKAKQFDLEIYFIADPGDPSGGTTADLQLAGFLSLLEQNKPGTLILPGLQREQVYARTWTPTREAGKAGWAQVTVVFAEQGRNQFPGSATSWPHTLLASALSARTAFGGALGAGLSLVDLPVEASDALTGTAIAAVAVLTVSAQLAGGTAPSSALSAAGILTAGYLAALPPLNDQDAAGATLDTAVLAAATAGLLAGWADALAGPNPDSAAQMRAIDALFAVYDGISSPSLPSATPTQAAELANQTAFTAAVRRLALTEAARLAASLDFASYDDAAALRMRFDIAFDTEVNLASAADGSREALADLQANTLLAISEAGANKAKLVPYIVPRPRTAIGLAQLFYPDDPDVPARAAELAARNGTIHPSFMPVSGERLSS